ncbi:MAG: choline dehydrogenase [Methylobacteriaceae bacterium]|nr:choline dehydrogenase [Methylobacteriaceae bacterium]
MPQFDYVVVGGGSSGCVVASRLSEDPRVNVCLLEAGNAGDNWVVNTPMATALMLPTKINNWGFETVPQPGLNGRRGYQPRGRALGGSSAINAMVYIRGHHSDYDHWAGLGNHGWSYADVLPYFKKAECNEDFRDQYHGTEGPLNVARLRSRNPFIAHFLEAAAQLQLPSTEDFNGERQEGVGTYQVTQKNGERCSAARAYIHPNPSRPNLHVVTGARTRRILFENGRAAGAEYQRGDKLERVTAGREVIVSCGALQTPQLLMVSGIGDAAHLADRGIGVVRNLPGVGKNLQDHIDYVFVYQSKHADLFGTSLAGARRLLKEIGLYRKSRRGMVTSNFAEAGGFLKTDPDAAAPDIQLHFVVGMVDDHSRKKRLGHGFSCHVCLLRPKSRGSIELKSKDPAAPPLIDPKFYDDPDDLEAMVKGFKITRRIMEAPALKMHSVRDFYTEHLDSDDEIRSELRSRSDTIYHPVGTCRMGSDAGAVVDPELRVHGVEGLRIVDASIMPTLIGGNTNAACIMIGEKAADMIRSVH